MRRSRIFSIVMVAVLPFFFTGCAADKATTGAINLATVVATKIASEVPLTTGSMLANGRIQDPHYRVTAGLFNGVMVDIGLDGAYLDGSIQGQGSGATMTDPAVRQLYADIATQPTLQQRVFDAYYAWKQTTRPAQ